MIKYLQWLCIFGVWGPLAAIAMWFALTSLSASTGGWGQAVLGMLLVGVSAHALAVSSLVGICLLAIGRSPRVLATSLSAIIGGLVSALLLSRIYFGIGV
jgi:hypothetical protein